MAVKTPKRPRVQRLDEAARAAWLYFSAGKTQDEIAASLQLSRQSIQRLVTLAVNEKLVRFQLSHSITSCMELAERLSDQFGLIMCDVVPTDNSQPAALTGVAMAASVRIERILNTDVPVVMCVGSGRTMRAAVEEITEFHRPQHKIVALVGSIAADGHATSYDVVMCLADKAGAQRFPVPAPVIAASVRECETLRSLSFRQTHLDLRTEAKASFVGVGDVGWKSPLHADGFIRDSDVALLLDQGAVGEITGWAFDSRGELLDNELANRVVSLPLERPPERLTVIVACGPSKVAPVRAALKGKLATGLITDEATAVALLDGMA